MPSLKPSRLRGVACCGRRRGGAAEAELGPAHRDGAEPDPGQVADRVHGDLRVVGAGLDAQVAVAARRGRGCRPGSAAARGAAAGCRSASPNRSLPSFSNRVGPNPKVRVRPAAFSPRASPVSVGGASYGVGGVLADRAARRHLARGRRSSSLQQRDQLVAGVGGDVEGGEVQPVLGGRGDAGLVRAVERVRRLVDARRRLLVRLLSVGEPAHPGRADRERTRAGGSEEPPAGERARWRVSSLGRGSVTG